MAEQWVNSVLTAYKDKICFVALQRYGVIKSAIMSGFQQTAANIQPIQDGSLPMISQQFLQKYLFINSESFRIDKLYDDYLLLSNPTNKFIQRVAVVSDPILSQIAVIGCNSFQSLSGLLEVCDILIEMFKMQKKLTLDSIQPQIKPKQDQKQQKTTSFMEFDFSHPDYFVFKFKAFQKLNEKFQQLYQEQLANQTQNTTLNNSENLDLDQLQLITPLNPLDASITLFALIDCDSPRKLQTAFELYELQNSFRQVAVVITIKNVSYAEFKKLSQDAPFLLKMNYVLDIGNADSFLRGNEQAYYTFSEDQEEIFTQKADCLNYLQSKQQYIPCNTEDRVMYQRLQNGNKLIINGVANPFVNEAAPYADQAKFFVFYCRQNIDNMNYLLNEIVKLQELNSDCYFVVALNPQQYSQYYYLRSKYSQLQDLNVIVDKQNAGFVFIQQGHTHVVYYQELSSEKIDFHMLQINDLLAQQSVELQRDDVQGKPEFIDSNETVTFQGVTFQKVSYERGPDVEQLEPGPHDNEKMKQQGKYIFCLLRNTFDYDEQLYQLYQISNRVKMDFVVCFAGATERETQQCFDRMYVLNELIILKDTTQKGAEILQKSNTLIRYYMINHQGQVYNTADSVQILDQLLKSEFQSCYMELARDNALLNLNEPKHLVYQGRIYKYFNQHAQFDESLMKHVTIVFTFLPPVSKIVNYDQFKQQLNRMAQCEKNYPTNYMVLCIVGAGEEMVQQISELTNAFKKTQIILDNNTKIQQVYQKLKKGAVRDKSSQFVIECHTFDDESTPDTLQSTSSVFLNFEDLELYLHDEDLDLTAAMPSIADPSNRTGVNTTLK